MCHKSADCKGAQCMHNDNLLTYVHTEHKQSQSTSQNLLKVTIARPFSFTREERRSSSPDYLQSCFCVAIIHCITLSLYPGSPIFQCKHKKRGKAWYSSRQYKLSFSFRTIIGKRLIYLHGTSLASDKTRKYGVLSSFATSASLCEGSLSFFVARYFPKAHFLHAATK